MFKLQTRQADGTWFDKRKRISDPDSVILFKTEREARFYAGQYVYRNHRLAGAMRVVLA